MDYITDLCKEFRKPEIIELAKELELSVKSTRAVVIAQSVVDDLEAEGVPEYDECSELMQEFLLAAGFVDEDGNIIENDEDDQEEEVPDEEPHNVVNVKEPECYSFADTRDPACNKCSVYESCMVARTNDRPECFGEMFDKNSEECQGCLEVTFCRKEYSNDA